jgi:hypothetical protein
LKGRKQVQDRDPARRELRPAALIDDGVQGLVPSALAELLPYSTSFGLRWKLSS